MRHVLKSSRRWVHAGWLLPLVLLTLPNCSVDATGTGPEIEFDAGDAPRTSAIMCDIPKVLAPSANGDCASAMDVAAGMPRAYAAVALAQSEKSYLVLDFREPATSACNGMPKKVAFQGPFPDGSIVCLNCAQQIPATYPNAHAACVAKCIDLTNMGEFAPPGGAQSFCQNARVSTNFNPTTCFGDVCSSGGTPNGGFVDPRRAQEPVDWIALGGNATASGSDLSKLTGVPGTFDSGAASDQTIAYGDAWVEFAANETGVSHVLGVSTGNGIDDADPTLAAIGFAISLNYDGNVYVLENGAAVISEPLGTYAPGERFRIRITDNNDGTATISYTRLIGACTPGTICNETTIATQTSPSPSYPLHVDATLREPGATISNATLVRIQELP